jgi:hypothetical protein
MSEDLLSRIQRELDERLRELRGAVDEHDRLQTELVALGEVGARPAESVALGEVGKSAAEPVALGEVGARPAEPVATVDPGPPVDGDSIMVGEPPVAPVRPRTVSPKVARLMHAPRRPALERAGVARVSAALLDRTRAGGLARPTKAGPGARGASQEALRV